MARLFAGGKITEAIWDSLWYEWQDRRNKLRSTLESLTQTYQVHVTNLDTALGIIAQVGVVYNVLERSDQKELLRQMVERVVVNSDGKATLDLRAPFTYLKDISDQVRRGGRVNGVEMSGKAKTSQVSSAGSRGYNCSNWVLLDRGGGTRTPNQRFWRPLLYH